MARRVFKISKESETIEVKFQENEYQNLDGTSEYGFEPNIGVEDYEVDTANGAIQHEQTTWDGKFTFKTMGYKDDKFQVFLSGVANGTIFGSDNSVDIKKINHITGKVEEYVDCVISSVTIVNGKVNDLCSISWEASTNGFPIVSDVVDADDTGDVGDAGDENGENEVTEG